MVKLNFRNGKGVIKVKQVSVEIIHKCPNRCVHCSSLSSMDCTKKISLDKMVEIIDGIANLNTEVLSISGGEPFLHENLIDIVEYSKSKGLKTYIYTSGIMIDKKDVVTTLNFNRLNLLSKAGLDKIIFDLPAVEEDIYDDFMGTKGYLKYALKSIDNSKKLGIFTEIHFVPTKINVNQIDKIVSYANSVGIDMISFLGLVPHGRAKGKDEQLYLDKDENEKIKRKLDNMQSDSIRIGIPLQVQKTEYICYAGREKLCVRYDGEVFGCEAFKYIELNDESGKTIKPDSIYDKGIEEIYHTSKYLKKEREFIINQLKEQGDCEKCPVQHSLRKKAV